MTSSNPLNGSNFTQITSGDPIQILSIPHDHQRYSHRKPKSNKKTDKIEYKPKVVWSNVLVFLLLHGMALYGLWLTFSGQAMWRTVLFNLLWLAGSSTGVTGGAHRLWAHRAYKAKLPFRIWLMLWQTAALQNDIHEWVRDHRVHHKFTDTNADPHNSNRGFFFCHVGWLMIKKHKDVVTKGRTIDMSDVEADPVVRWQRKYYIPMVILLTFLLPTYIPVYFWSENTNVAYFCCVARYVVNLNGTWSVNSAAHMWGYKPYDSSINPSENIFVSTIGFGEGWHNYHHTFPWDYKAAELGSYTLNITTALLDFMAYIGQAYDLKTVTEDMIRRRAIRTGDGSWKGSKNEENVDKNHQFNENFVWGWGDKDMKEEDIKEAKIYNSLKED